MPVPIEDISAMRSLADKHDAVFLCWCVDRAAANWVVLKWLFQQVDKLPLNIMPHSEPCSAHGVALVKGRNRSCKQIALAICSFSRLMRDDRFCNALRGQLISIVDHKLKVSEEPRPVRSAAVGRSLIHSLYGDESSDYLYTTTESGGREPSQLLQDLTMLFELVDPDPHSDEMVHHCVVVEGSRAHQQGHAVGSRCCSSRAEAVEKTTVAVLNWITGSAWAAPALPRWTNVTISLARYAIGCAAKGLLPTALRELKTHWGLSEAVVPTLERMIQSDQGNYDAKKKLKLLKIVRALCTPEALTTIATMVVSTRPLDRLLYAVLGFERSRASLLDLCGPRRNLISECQDTVLALLRNFDAENDEWKLLRSLAGDYNSMDARQLAFAQLVQFSVGLVDHFELHLEQPPYNLLKLCFADVPHEEKQAAIRRFVDAPSECLPLMAQRLRKRCPSAGAMLAHFPRLLRHWASEATIAIDATERSHAQMRVDLHSVGRAKSSTASCARVFSRQVLAEHIARGGVSPMSQPLVSAGQSPDQDAEVVAPQSAAPSRHPGSCFLRFRNSKLHAHKVAHAPNRPLTAEELKKFESDVKDKWAVVLADDRQRGAWQRLNRSEARLKHESKPLALMPPALDFKGLYASSNHHAQIVAPSAMVREHESTKMNSEKVWHDPGTFVYSPAPLRCAAPRASVDSAVLVRGCFCKKKNVCREHGLRADQAEALDEITKKLCAWTKSLGKEIAQGAEQFVWLESPKPEGGTINTIAFLADCRFKPEMQFFIQCHLYDDIERKLFFDLPEFPFKLRLAVGQCRLSASTESLHVQTSDELGMQLLRYSTEWHIMPLAAVMLCDTPSLLNFEVLGNGAEFAMPVAAQRQRPSHAWRLPAEFSLGDPVAHALEQLPSGGAAGGRGPSSGGEGAVDGLAFDDAEVSGDDEEFDDLTDNELDDLQDLGAHTGGIELADTQAFLDAEIANGHSAAVPAFSSGEAEADGSDEGELDDDDLFGDGSGLVREPTAEDAVAAATLNDTYVTCTLEPWHTGNIGRITTFPEYKPLERRSAACRCYMHPGCSVLKSRSKVTDAFYMQWFFSKKPPPIYTPRAEMERLAAEHLADFHRRFAEASARPGGVP